MESRATSSSCAARFPKGCSRCCACRGSAPRRFRRFTRRSASRRSRSSRRPRAMAASRSCRDSAPAPSAKILKGIAYLRENSAYMLYPRARAESELVLAAVRAHPGVETRDARGLAAPPQRDRARHRCRGLVQRVARARGGGARARARRARGGERRERRRRDPVRGRNGARPALRDAGAASPWRCGARREAARTSAR